MYEKVFALILVIAVLIPACGAFGESGVPAASEEVVQAEQFCNAYDEYDRKGYTHGSFNINTPDDGSGLVLRICFNSADKTDCVLVEAALTDEECAEIAALDFFDENQWENQWNIVVGLPADRITVTSLNDRIPSEEVNSQYLEKTVEDLTNDGYEWSTDDKDKAGNNILVFQSQDSGIMYAVTLAGDPDPEELSDERDRLPGH